MLSAQLRCALSPSKGTCDSTRRSYEVADADLPSLIQVSTTVSGFSDMRLDALIQQPLGEVGVVAGALAADADVLAPGLAGLDRHAEHELDGRVALVE